MTVMLNSQGIGLMTVIALSGCSVVLLVLGHQKLLELKKNSSCLQAKVSQEGGLGSHSRSRQHGKGRASISWSMMNSGKRDCGKLCSQELWKSAPTALNGSQSSPDKKRNLVKKVLFSEDVVEPSGDNVAYRRRHVVILNSGQPRSQKRDDICCKNEGIEKPIEYSKSGAKQRRVETKIPGNRMALYIGICNDRSRRVVSPLSPTSSCFIMLFISSGSGIIERSALKI